MTTTRQVALVTGATSGIGMATATALVAAGFQVIGTGRSTARLTAPAGVTYVDLDVTLDESVASAVEQVIDRFGRIDVLVNNAGIYFHHPIATTGFDEWQQAWRRTVELNLYGPADLAWHAVRHMTSGARIINIGSRGAFRGEPDAPAYGAAKAGLHAMTQSLAQSLAPQGIAVAGVAPGFVRTDMVTDFLAGPEGDAILAQSPFGRVAEPEEVAAAVAWLATEKATWASGTIIDVNGASHLR